MTAIPPPRRIIVGISGASGAIYGVRILQALRDAGVESHLVISRAGTMTIEHELDMPIAEIRALADVVHPIADVGAACASGSFDTAGMIVAPCSMKTLAEIAMGMSSNLLTRSADVVLKERRRLVLLARETPLTLTHIRHMETVTLMGGIIAPPVPALYARPADLDEMIDHTVGRTLDLFGIDTGGVRRWSGLKNALKGEAG